MRKLSEHPAQAVGRLNKENDTLRGALKALTKKIEERLVVEAPTWVEVCNANRILEESEEKKG